MKSTLIVFAAFLAAMFGLSMSAEAQYGPGPGGPQYGPGPGGFAGPQYGPGPGGYAAGPYAQNASYQPPPPPMSQPMGQAACQPGGCSVGAPGCSMGAPSCSTGSCQPGCDCDDCGDDCCDGWCNRAYGYGEFLYLRARNVDVAYVVATNGPQNVGGIPVPQGPVGVADPKNQGGYRVGVGAYLNQCSAVQVGYTEYNANTNDSQTSPGGIAAAPGLYSLVSHPTPFNAATLALDANANYQVGFKLIDADYRGLIAYCCDYQINYLVGVRYGQLTQRFNANYLGNANNNPESVSTSVNFYGAGFRTGLEGERYGANNNLFFYGKTFVSLLGGENKATYTEDNATSNTFIVNTKWKAGRVVTIYDLEMGGGWQNDCKNIRVSAGYLFSFWYNTVPTNEWIQAVQANNYVNQSTNFHGITSFDGFVARAEFRY